jgi:hypothetical protein
VESDAVVSVAESVESEETPEQKVKTAASKKNESDSSAPTKANNGKSKPKKEEAKKEEAKKEEAKKEAKEKKEKKEKKEPSKKEPSKKEPSKKEPSKKEKKEPSKKEPSKKEPSKKKKNEDQMVDVVDGRLVFKKIFHLTKEKNVDVTISVENRPFKPDEKIDIKFDIKNQSSKTIKSIKCVLETQGIDDKKTKKKKGAHGVATGNEDEFFCGARFPLDKYTNCKGNDGYRLPKKLASSSDTTKHELHFMFPVRSRAISSWKNIDAWLPIEIN